MKRLVVCCDGTWQNLSCPHPTNVVKMAQMVQPTGPDGIPQIVFYDEGIGSSQGIEKLGSGAFGWGIDKNIQDAYRFLCLNYYPGDEIYLFGFSRGAYTVRSLAGLIYCSGLLERCHIRKAPEAYRLYRDRTTKPGDQAARLFRSQYGESVPITLMGCWDTVGALGIPDQIPFVPFDDWINAQYKFHDTTLNQQIQTALHAVAIDEHRQVFDVTPMQQSPHRRDRQVYQNWFVGTHGCVGGGTLENQGLSDIPLLWMVEQMHQLGLGLTLDPTKAENGIEPNSLTIFDSSAEILYALTGLHQRKIGSFADVHSSVKQRWQHFQPAYRPKNLKPFAAELDRP